MENGSNIGIQLEALKIEQREANREFADHVKGSHPKGIPVTSCHPCINFKQILLLQDVQIRKMTAEIIAPSGRLTLE